MSEGYSCKIYDTYYTIPPHMMEGLLLYIEHGILPGSFLCAVLTNDLKEALANADMHNIKNIPAYVSYLYNEVDSRCWGSREKVQDWVNAKALERLRDEEAGT